MFPRKITSLHEDMQKLGLSRLVDKDINGRAQPGKVREPVTESRNRRPAPKTAKQVAEAKRQIVAQRKRAAQIREQRMAKKLASYQTRLQRIERVAKKKGAKVESRMRVIKGLKKRVQVMESYDVRKQFGDVKPTPKQMAESFMKVASLAGTLGRVFGVFESFLGETENSLGVPVMHAGSAYGYDTDVNNIADGSHDSPESATDYGSNKEDDEAEPKDDMAEDDESPLMGGDDDEKTEDDDEKDDVTTEDDDEKDDATTEDDDDEKKDDVTEDDDDGEKKTEDDDEKDDDVTEDDDEKDDVTTEDDDEKKDDKVERRTRRRRSESKSIRMPMDYELHTIRLEAEDMAVAVGGEAENVNMGYASNLMNDMVSYLGGAMNLYFKLQQSMKDMGYVGQDQPVSAGGDAPQGDKNDAYIGTVDKPDGETALDQGGTSNAPKTGDATDTSGVKEPKAEAKDGKKKT